MDYSIVIPVHNEAGNVGPLVREFVDNTRADPPARIILVDDASTDDTADVIRRLHDEAGPIVELVRNEQCRGQSTAVYNGVQAATTRWIVTLDGDGQNDPADVPTFIERLKDSEHEELLLIGHRTQRNDTWQRRAASRIANGIRGWLLHDRSPDTGCGLKAFSREFFLRLPYFDHMHRFMPALTRQYGGEVVSIPVRHRARRSGTSKYGILDRLWVGIVDLFGVAWLGRRNRLTRWTRDSA